jgi:hypothetical protein
MFRSIVVFFRTVLPLAVVIGMPLAVIGTRRGSPVPLAEQAAALWRHAVAFADPGPHLGEPSESAELIALSRPRLDGNSLRIPLSSAAASVPAEMAVDYGLDDEVRRRLSAARRRLEELGARYVLFEPVEAIDGDTPRFRFHCLMPLPGSVFSRPFDSVDADPAQAIERVLLDVIQWQQAWPETADDDPRRSAASPIRGLPPKGEFQAMM